MDAAADHHSTTTTYTRYSILHNTVQLLLPGCHRPSLTLHGWFTSGVSCNGPPGWGLLSAILYEYLYSPGKSGSNKKEKKQTNLIK